MNLFDASYKIIYPDEYNYSAGTKTVSKLDFVNGKCFVPGLVSKNASEVDNFVKTITPDKKHSYVHLISLGAMEWYGPNKRGDAFNESGYEYNPPEPYDKKAVTVQLEGGLKEFHNPTFMANGRVYREHHSILSGGEPQGDVVFATYNEPMHRGELIIRLDNDKWADDIEKIEKGEPTYYSMGCHIDGTLVTMSDGSVKAIENISPGDQVLTHTHRVAVVESTRRRPTKPGEIFKLTVRGLPDTYVTEEHPYWVFKGYDRCVGCGGNLPIYKDTCGQRLRHWCSSSCSQTINNSNNPNSDFKPLSQEYSFGWVPVKDLEVGMYVAIKLGRDNSVKRESIDPKLALIIGYYLSEGNLLYTTKRALRGVEFTFNINESAYINELLDALKSVFPAKLYVKDRPNRHTTTIITHSRELAHYLYEHANEYCYGKRLSPYIMNCSNETLAIIVSKYINGDGNLSKRGGRTTMCTVSQHLANQLHTILLWLGIPSTLTKSNVDGRKKKRIPYSINIRTGYGEPLIPYTDKLVTRTTKNSNNICGGHMLLKISKLERISEPLYVNNIHVINDAEDHSFFANGAPVHNCLTSSDICSICGKKVSPKSPERCEHLKNMVLTIDEKGNQVKAITDHPIFYDISRVARPADKIAFSLSKVASEGDMNTCKLNTMPVSLVDKLNSRMRIDRLDIMRKVASEESSDLKTQLPVKLVDSEDEDIIKKIKQEDVPKVIFILKQHRAVLPPPAFIRLVGGEGTAVDDAMPLIGEHLEGIFGKLLNSPILKDFIEDGTYEGEENYDRELLESVLPLINKYSLDEQPIKKRIIRIVFSPSAKHASEHKIVTPMAHKLASELAKEYARYQLAFLTKNKDLGSIRLTLANNHANIIV